jgi:hypothetical protein
VVCGHLRSSWILPDGTFVSSALFTSEFDETRPPSVRARYEAAARLDLVVSPDAGPQILAWIHASDRLDLALADLPDDPEAVAALRRKGARLRILLPQRLSAQGRSIELLRSSGAEVGFTRAEQDGVLAIARRADSARPAEALLASQRLSADSLHRSREVDAPF